MLAVARVAGIQAAKRTPDMIPLCHPLLVGSVFVNFEIGDDYVEVEAQVETVDRTGVEMEALTPAPAALTIYDMCKSMDRSMVIGELTLWEKTGGRSGTYRREKAPTTCARRHTCRCLALEQCRRIVKNAHRPGRARSGQGTRLSKNEDEHTEWVNWSCSS